MKDEFDVLISALEQGKPAELAKVYVHTLKKLVELERKYNLTKIQKLDFESRTALDKQELKLLQEDQSLRETQERIAHSKALLRACGFVMDALKLQNAGRHQDESRDPSERKRT